MAKKDNQNSNSAGADARVLVDCHLGKVNDVVTLDADALVAAGGLVDSSPDAVAFARTLAKD